MVISARPQRRRRPIGTILTLLLVAAGLAYVLIPLAMGRQPVLPLSLSLPELFAAGSDSDDEVGPPAPGKVRVLVSGREIAAYAKVSRDDVWDLEKNRWAFSDVDQEVVDSGGILVDARHIIGRVLDHTKPPGYAFTESDFMPKGTRPGIVAGIPAGKRALRIDVETVNGIVGLQPGDRFDILAAVPVGDLGAAGSAVNFAGPYADQMKAQSKLAGLSKQARVDVLVQNGVVVSGLKTRQVPVSQQSLTQGMTVRTIPKQEMVIAIGPSEVAELVEAIAVEAEVLCIARSGRLDDDPESLTESSEPDLPWSFGGGGRPGSGGGGGHVIEAIHGGERKLVPVPPSGVSE